MNPTIFQYQVSNKISNDYLPLMIGNYWDFKAVGHSGESLMEHREVEDYVMLNGKQYYLLISTRPSKV